MCVSEFFFFFKEEREEQDERRWGSFILVLSGKETTAFVLAHKRGFLVCVQVGRMAFRLITVERGYLDVIFIRGFECNRSCRGPDEFAPGPISYIIFVLANFLK